MVLMRDMIKDNNEFLKSHNKNSIVLEKPKIEIKKNVIIQKTENESKQQKSLLIKDS